MASDRKTKRPDDDAIVERRETQPARSRGRTGRGCLGSLLMTAISPFRTLLLIGAGILIGVAVLWLISQVTDPFDEFLGIFGIDRDAEPEVVDSRTIVLNIQQMAVLETVKSGILITKTVVDSSAAPDAEMEISFVGSVRAGVDLSQIGDDDVIINPDNSLTVVLPPTQIMHCDLGKPEIHRWDCRAWAGIQDCSSRREKTESVAYDRAMEELLETANELDLLTLATQNAQATLFDLLKKLGYEQVKFEVSTDPAPPLDETCVVG